MTSSTSDPSGGVPAADADIAADARAADRRTLGRALRAGVITTLVLAAIAVLANLAFGGDGVALAIWITSAIVVGALVSSGWLVLALILDLVAGEVPSRWRVAWTAVVFALAFVSPVLPAAMLQVAAAR
ncbi:MAG TPA: hypothetical protein VMM13_17970 [Euzebya sp.]|nr:hypothetical protein [Euzebya sp.]